VIKQQPKHHWLCLLENAKVPCGPINDLEEVFDDPHIQARGMVETWNHPLRSDLKLVASPMKLSLTPIQHHLPPPCLGQHTADVLKDWLGLNEIDLKALQQEEAI
jgi:crotonobetainyl-CoA:carnitine CoA-transferase CaiB-like acyl-CoA transferase